MKDSKGEEVVVYHKTFTVTDKDGYTVVYSAEVNGEMRTKTDTLKVVANHEPIVDIDGKETAFIIGGSYTLPSVKAYDYYDGALTASVEIYKEAGEEDVKCEYDGGETFTPSETGTYYVKAFATNSNEQTGFNTLRFFARASAQDGEWDSFDDEGAEYTLKTDSEVSKVEWKEEFAGRKGVLGVSLKATNAYSSSFRIFPKTDDKTQYAGKEYFVINVYVEGAEGALLNYLFCNPNATSLPMYKIRYNGWNTFVFKADGVLNNWAYFTSNATKTEGMFMGTTRKACTMYFDSIYFASAQELTGMATEENNVVTLGFEAGGANLDYSVYFDGEKVPTTNNTFMANYVGEYTIYPHITDNTSVAYTGNPITYISGGAETLSVNTYDETVALNATEYVLPQVSADGYTVNAPKTIFTDWSGKSEEKEFTTVTKGYYDFVFTADKAGAKSLYKRVRVRVGNYLDGEIFNVTDVDAPIRMSSMGMGASFATVDGKVIDEAYKNEKYLKIAYDLNNQYLMSTGYVNFAPSATLEDISSDVYDEITTDIYVKATLNSGCQMPNMSLSFFGSKVTLTPNTMTRISLLASAFETRYYRLANIATYADMAFTFSVSGFAEDKGFKDTFSELVIYMGDVQAVVRNDIQMPTSILTITSENYTSVYNPNHMASQSFVSNADFASQGLTSNGYMGNAVKITQTKIGTQGTFMFNMPILSNLNKAELKENYTHVRFWVAFKTTDGKYSTFGNGLLKSCGDYGKTTMYNDGVWRCCTMTIEDFLAAVNGVASPTLLTSYNDSEKERAFYFGDIELVAEHNEKNYDNIGADKEGAWS